MAAADGSERRETLRTLAVVPLVVALVYSDAWRYGLVWDDFTLFRHVADGGRAAGPLPFSENYVRPLGVWTVRAIESLGVGAGGQHVFNVVLHACNALGVAALSTKLSRSRSVRSGIAAGLVYGLHPALIEPTAWISGRFDLLLATSLIAMLWVDLVARGSGWTRAISVAACVGMGLASKETAAVFPVVLVLWWWGTASNETDDTLRSAEKERVFVGCTVGAVIVAWIALRVAVIGSFAVAEPQAVGADISDRLLASGHASVEYLRLTVVPWGAIRPLHHAPTALDGGFCGWAQVAMVSAAVCALTFYAVRRRGASAIALAGLVLLAPVVHLHPLNLAGGALVAERYLAAPLAVICVVAARVAARIVGKRTFTIVVALICVANAATVRTLAPRWGDPTALWAWTEAMAPEAELPPINLAKTHYERGRFADALAAAERALAIDPQHPFAANNACAAALELGRPDDAVAFCAIGLDSGRASPSHWVNMMRAQVASGDLAGAVDTHATARDRWGLRTERMEALRAEAIDQLGAD